MTLTQRLRSGKGADRELDRFKSKYRVDEATGCWLWTASTVPSPRGPGFERGQFSIAGKPILAHRASYLMFKGEIPEGLEVCHRCDVPRCVNPDHLFVGTRSDNMQDMLAKGRSNAQRNPGGARAAGVKGGLMNTWAKGERHGRAKLTAEDVTAIRTLIGERRRLVDIAAQFGVHVETIGRIKRGELWKQAN